MVTTIYGVGTADGVNERGFAAHMLFLNATDFGPRDVSKPGVHAGLWAQYLLDNAASVTEALALMDKIQIVMTEARGTKTTVHLALEDASGDSAIIEYVRRQAPNPSRTPIQGDDQRSALRSASCAAQGSGLLEPSSTMPLPGNVNPEARFQRATYFLAMLPTTKDEREAVAGVLAISTQRICSVWRSLQGLWHLQYRVQDGDRSHQRDLLLRIDDQPECHLG